MPQIESRRIPDLAPYDRNARVHSAEQIEQLTAAIKEFGFTNPVLITPEGMIVAGHGRVEAAKAAGLEEVPTLTVGADWSPEKIRAYILADNKLALNASWDDAILKAELADLSDLGVDLDLTGFVPADLSLIFGELPGVGGLPGGNSGPGSSDPAVGAEKRRTLMERFGLAPFSVLSARGGWWQDRKRAWLTLGIESEVGRGGNLIGRSIFERCSIILSGTLGSGGTGAAYDRVRAFVMEWREKGLSDDEIEAKAIEISGRKEAPATGISGSNRLAPGGGGALADRMAKGEGTKRKRKAKTDADAA